MKTLSTHTIVIIVVGFVCAYIAAPIPDKPGFRKGQIFDNFRIKLGLDLSGGAELQYRVLFPPDTDDQKREAALNKTIDIIQRRIQGRGLVEPDIRPVTLSSGGEKISMIAIQLPGVDQSEIGEYEQLLSTVGKVEWRLGAPKEQHERARRGQPIDPNWERVPAPPDFRCEDHSFSEGDRKYILIQNVPEGHEPPISGRDVREARPDFQNGEWVVAFTLDADAAELFHDWTKRAIRDTPHAHIAILKDGTVVSAPEVRTEIAGGRGVITGHRDQKEAGDLSIILNSGSLPYPLGRLDPDTGTVERGKAEQVLFVGAALGSDAIRRGLLALSIAAGFTFLFALVYYQGPGIAAVVSLLFNLLFLGVALAFFRATVTLPGLAALVLTIGMAVDANILIFERMREELAKGKTPLQAFESGHERAFAAILDGNLTTFIAGAILYFVARGTPVGGFGTMLMIGICTTLASVLWVGRSVLRSLIASGVITQARMLRLFPTPNIPWTRLMPAGVALSTVMVCAAVVGTIWASGEDPGRYLLALKVEGWSTQANVYWIVVRALILAAAIGAFVLHGPRRVAAISVLAIALIGFAVPISGVLFRNDSHLWGVDFRAGTALYFRLREPEPVEEVRASLVGFKPEYAEGRVQPIADPQAPDAAPPAGTSWAFLFRTSQTDVATVERDVTEALGARIWRPPFEDLPPGLLEQRARQAGTLAIEDDRYEGRVGCVEEGEQHDGHRAASGFVVHLRARDIPANTNVVQRIRDTVRLEIPTTLIRRDVEDQPAMLIEEVAGGDEAVRSFAVLFSKADVENSGGTIRARVQERLRALAQRPAEMGGEQAAPFPLTPDPFIAVQQLGQVEAKRLRDDSMWGLLWACVLIAIYVALRFFRSLRFGLAAVLPLFHDALVAVGVMAVCMKLVPETTGLNFDINLPAVAAILTVIGYSVNDTIIVFDRIRENLRVKKREAFADVINGSVNETLSRTVLTSGTTLVAAVALYVLTATTGSGIANFAFPMIAGVIVGTYSSVFVAAWLLKVLYRDERPELAA